MKYVLFFLPLITLLNHPEIPSGEKAFAVHIEDAVGDSVQIDVQLTYNERQQPEYYFCHVETPVCKEGLCHILVVDLYWDLLGNFHKYELPKNRPLTKFDHEEFTEADYEKLDNILADKRSLLGEYALEDLVDETTEMVSQEVDAVTGATMKAVENTVVSGAVYSTHALWHLVNGKIPQRIPTHTDSLWSDNMLRQFLASDHYPYHYHALDLLSTEKFAQHLPAIVRLMNESSVFVSRYAIKKFPEALSQDSVGQATLIQQFSSSDFRTQEIILNKLKIVPLHKSSLAQLMGQLDQLSEQQLEQVLAMLLANSDNLTDATLSPVVSLLDHANPAYAKLALQTLQPLAQQYQQLNSALQNYETTTSNR